MNDSDLNMELEMYHSEYAKAKKMLSADCKLCNGINNDGSKLVFFLGAGINGRAMLWDSIIKTPLKKAVKRFCYEHNIGDICIEKENWTSTLQASIVKHISKTAYINQLRDFIYSGVGPTKDKIRELITNIEENTDFSKDYYSLYALAKIIVENKNVIAVVTQNYDKFLTYAIDEYAKRHKVKIKCEEVYGSSYGDEKDAKWRYLSGYSNTETDNRRVLPILHVHGYLAPYDELQNNLTGDEIVMTDEEFYSLAKDNYSWITTSQLHFLNHYTCIFAGLSLTDQTSQRMLHFVNKSGDLTHNKYYLTAHPWNNGLNSQDVRINYLKSSIYKELGMTTVMSVDGYFELFKDITDCMINNK